MHIPQQFAPDTPFPFYYDITAADSSGTPVYHEVFVSDYYLLSDDTPRAQVFTCTLPPLPAGACRITVCPMNCFFNGSDSRSVDVITE